MCKYYYVLFSMLSRRSTHTHTHTCGRHLEKGFVQEKLFFLFCIVKIKNNNFRNKTLSESRERESERESKSARVCMCEYCKLTAARKIVRKMLLSEEEDEEAN